MTEQHEANQWLRENPEEQYRLLTENVKDEVSIGGRVQASPEECVEQIRRLKSIADARGYPLVPGHDPEVWPALTREMAERFGRSPAR